MQFEESTFIAAAPAKIFSTYAAVSQWPSWDLEVESASLDDAFNLGGTGKIKPKGAPESKIELIELTENKSFTIECKLPLCKMHFVHVLSEQGDSSTNVKNQLIFTGFLAPLFGRLIGKGIAKTMPGTLLGLKHYIEQKV
jgi:hypothetical protein